jgi:tetratricopeptide (TPR) repeat protein
MVWFGNLTAEYPLPSHWPIGAVIGASCVLIAVTLFAITAARRWPWITVGWLWFLGTLVPMIGLIQAGYQSMADRYTYIPGIGLAIAVVFSLPELPRFGWFARVSAAATAGVVLGVLCIFTIRQVSYWHDLVSLWAHAVDVTADNWTAHRNYGGALADKFRDEEALQHFGAALSLNPKDLDTRIDESMLLLRMGRIEDARDQVETACRLNPSSARAQCAMGDILRKQNDLPAAVLHYHRALDLDPGYARAMCNLGIALAASGHVPEAIAQFRSAVVADPLFAEGHTNLAIALAQTGHADEAFVEFNAAVELAPTRPEIRVSFGNALLRWGRVDDAIEQLREAHRLRPGDERVEQSLRTAVARRAGISSCSD